MVGSVTRNSLAISVRVRISRSSGSEAPFVFIPFAERVASSSARMMLTNSSGSIAIIFMCSFVLFEHEHELRATPLGLNRNGSFGLRVVKNGLDGHKLAAFSSRNFLTQRIFLPTSSPILSC